MFSQIVELTRGGSKRGQFDGQVYLVAASSRDFESSFSVIMKVTVSAISSLSGSPTCDGAANLAAIGGTICDCCFPESGGFMFRGSLPVSCIAESESSPIKFAIERSSAKSMTADDGGGRKSREG